MGIATGELPDRYGWLTPVTAGRPVPSKGAETSGIAIRRNLNDYSIGISLPKP